MFKNIKLAIEYIKYRPEYLENEINRPTAWIITPNETPKAVGKNIYSNTLGIPDVLPQWTQYIWLAKLILKIPMFNNK